jgi:transposase
MYRALYDELSQRRREQTYPWPSRIGIDEHSFRKNKATGRMDFVTFIIDQKNKKAFEVADGRAVADLDISLKHIPGRENVQLVTMDLSDTYRQFTRRYFTNARIVADKFHVVRLLHPAINRYRKAITGDRRTLPVRRLLLKNGDKLSFHTRSALWNWLAQYPDLRELYAAKEAIHRLYRITTYDRARAMLKNLIDRLHTSKLPELQTLRKTLRSWFDEILNYFKWRVTNARVEGYNNVAKLIKKRAYGYRSFENYRLRLLHACA